VAQRTVRSKVLRCVRRAANYPRVTQQQPKSPVASRRSLSVKYAGTTQDSASLLRRKRLEPATTGSTVRPGGFRFTKVCAKPVFCAGPYGHCGHCGHWKYSPIIPKKSIQLLTFSVPPRPSEYVGEGRMSRGKLAFNLDQFSGDRPQRAHTAWQYFGQ